MSKISIEDKSSLQSSTSLSSTSVDNDTIKNMNVINNNLDKVLNEKKHLLQSLKPYRQTANHQTPLEQQHYRSRWNLITILISIFILISITIGIYHILRYFINKNISIRSTIIPNERKSQIESFNKSLKLKR